MVQTFITNWEYVGGSRGIYIMRPTDVRCSAAMSQYLFFLMTAMLRPRSAIARTIERSAFGFGLAAIRDDEAAAEIRRAGAAAEAGRRCCRARLMGMAGAPLPFYVAYLDPTSAFSLSYTVNTVAMPLVGGTRAGSGP